MAKASEPQSLLAPITAAIQQQAVCGVAFSVVGADENGVLFFRLSRDRCRPVATDRPGIGMIWHR
ncbi:hypothetical protein PZ02_04515 [Lacticaseibacillus rhamnosus]|nr:hypothetical protein PZ02_04515 [Lacticaseibacillus rhamnosus]